MQGLLNLLHVDNYFLYDPSRCYIQTMRVPFLTMLAVLLAPLIASGQEVGFKTERGNLYSAGATVSITENAPNDIIAAGGDVTISGTAGNELLAAGGSITLSGKTAGDARAAGGNITLAGTVGGEMVLAGGKIHLLPGAAVKGGLFAASGEIMLEGAVGGGARIIGGTVTINGTIGKDAEIKAERLVIGRNARIQGGLRYEAPEEAQIDQGAVIAGGKQFTRTEFRPRREEIRKIMGAFWIAKLFAVMTAGIVIFLLLPQRTAEVTALGVNRFGQELLIGFLVLVAVPALMLLLFMTLLGSLLGAVALFLYIAFLLLSSVFGALIFTRLISGSVFRKDPALTWPMILAGVLVYQVLGLIPFLGWIFKFLFFLTALGALCHAVYSVRDRRSLPPGGQTP
jgi:cytoskeletal protein CcmA (bactofilin family)